MKRSIARWLGLTEVRPVTELERVFRMALEFWISSPGGPEALAALSASCVDPDLQGALRGAREAVGGGASLSEALRPFTPAPIPPGVVAWLEVGETEQHTGLPEVREQVLACAALGADPSPRLDLWRALLTAWPGYVNREYGQAYELAASAVRDPKHAEWLRLLAEEGGKVEPYWGGGAGPVDYVPPQVPVLFPDPLPIILQAAGEGKCLGTEAEQHLARWIRLGRLQPPAWGRRPLRSELGQLLLWLGIGLSKIGQREALFEGVAAWATRANTRRAIGDIFEAARRGETLADGLRETNLFSGPLCAFVAEVERMGTPEPWFWLAEAVLEGGFGLPGDT